MSKPLSESIKTDDFKNEKHVPIIEIQGKPTADEFFDVSVTLGKEVAHPNTTEHHIRWMDLCFLPEGEGQVYHLAHFEFGAHGESAKGPNEGPVHTHHCGTASIKVSKGGTLQALAYCNIHGLWESTQELTL